MPLRVLRAVVERLHFGQQLMNDAKLAGQCEANRRALGLQQQFFELAPDALGRQIVERDRRADPGGFRIDRQVEPRGKLQRTEDTEGVVCEGCRIHDSEDTELEVLSAVKRIEIFVRERIPADGVDREITPPRRLLEWHRRIALDGEALVAAAGFRFPARQGHVNRAQFVDGKGLADRLDAAQRLQERLQRLLRDAEHLEVEVLRSASQQAIADESADAQRAPARVAHGGGDASRLLFQIHRDSI